MKNTVNRVVITGMGTVNPIGNSVKEFDTALQKGVCGINKLNFEREDIKVHCSANLKNINIEDYIDRREMRRLDTYCQYALISVREAVKDAGVDFSKMDVDRVGVIYTSGIGGLSTLCEQYDRMKEKGAHGVSPLLIPMMIPNMAAGNISIELGIRGVSYAPVTACASSTHAIGEAFRYIKYGYQDMVITGGAEGCIIPLAIAGFQNMHALSQAEDVNEASLPFDKRRGGFVMGEGAGALVLESLESAQKRGAKIYGEIIGYGATTDAYHITSPHPDGIGAGNAMKFAMDEAQIVASEVDYINAHGTGTALNDKFETKAIKLALGEDTKVLVNSTKSMTGHLLGGTGAVEVISTLLQMQGGYVHENINFKEKDEECDLNIVTKKLDKQIDIAISNSLGFGGHNGSLVIKRGI